LAIREAVKGFRRLKEYAGMPRLVNAFAGTMHAKT
jgi:hypothetical protein